MGLASVLLSKGDTTGAIDLLVRAVEAHPSSFHARLALGEAYLTSGKCPEAVSTMEEALELMPGSPRATEVISLCQLQQSS